MLTEPQVPAWALFAFLFLLGWLVYYPIAPYMLVDDGISGLWEVKHMRWTEVFGSNPFKSLYQLHYALLKIYYFIFGIHSYRYFFLFVGLQALIGTLWYVVIPKIGKLFQWNNNRILFLIVPILLLVSPNNVENIAWAATSHYNWSMIFYLLILWALYRYIEGSRFYLLPFHFLFVLSLFTMEISLLFPCSAAIIILLRFAIVRDRKALWQQACHVLLPMLFFTILSFGLLKWLYNTWLPHGAGNEDYLPEVSDALTHFWLYTLQGLANTQFLEVSIRQAYYGLVKTYLFLPLLLTTGGALIWAIHKRYYTVVFFMLHIALFLAPNLFRFGASSGTYENVRFVYFALPFILSLFFLLVARNVGLTMFIFIVLFFYNLTLLNRTKQEKMLAGALHHHYLSELQEHSRKDVYLLNVPSFCNDFYVFRSAKRVGIDAEMRNHGVLADDFHEVLWYYAKGVNDVFTITRTAANEVSIQAQTNGVWLMREQYGATDYETADFKVRVGEWGKYVVTFKEPIPSQMSLLLYSDGKMQDVTDILRYGDLNK